MFIGGVATQRGMVKALEERLQVPVTVPPDCEYVCALGAALLGLKRLQMTEEKQLQIAQMPETYSESKHAR
jgi:activator of 2-hydroxyglutaryl-CoA dehydratase